MKPCSYGRKGERIFSGGSTVRTATESFAKIHTRRFKLNALDIATEIPVKICVNDINSSGKQKCFSRFLECIMYELVCYSHEHQSCCLQLLFAIVPCHAYIWSLPFCRFWKKAVWTKSMILLSAKVYITEKAEMKISIRKGICRLWVWDGKFDYYFSVSS